MLGRGGRMRRGGVAVAPVVTVAWGAALAAGLLAGCAGQADREEASTAPTTPAAARIDPAATPEAEGFERTVDSDGDLLTDDQEVELGTDPHAVDTDGDGITDFAELVQSLTDPTLVSTDGRVPDGRSDLDGDGIGFLQEREFGTDPLEADTDGDGIDDAEELAGGTDPLLADTDGDGIDDGLERAGGLDPLVADAGGTVALPLPAGDVTVIAEGPGDAVAHVRVKRGGHVGWEGSPAIVTETVGVLDFKGVHSLTLIFDPAGLEIDPEDVGILVEGFDTGTLVALDSTYDAEAGTVTGTWEVTGEELWPTFAIIDVPTYRSLFE